MLNLILLDFDNIYKNFIYYIIDLGNKKNNKIIKYSLNLFIYLFIKHVINKFIFSFIFFFIIMFFFLIKSYYMCTSPEYYPPE